MNDISDMKYVKTQFGRVPIEDLPFVQPETIYSKYSTLIIFSITIVVMIMAFNLLFPPNTKQCFITERIPPAHQASVKTARVEICIPLTSILDKVIFVVKTANGLGLVPFQRSEMKVLKVKNPKFMMYSIDIKAEIIQIILVSVPGRYVTYADIALYNTLGTKVWTFSSNIDIAQENYITITQLEFLQNDYGEDTDIALTDTTTAKKTGSGITLKNQPGNGVAVDNISSPYDHFDDGNDGDYADDDFDIAITGVTTADKNNAATALNIRPSGEVVVDPNTITSSDLFQNGDYGEDTDMALIDTTTGKKLGSGIALNVQSNGVVVDKFSLKNNTKVIANNEGMALYLSKDREYYGTY
jgi:hypothetical protein